VRDRTVAASAPPCEAACSRTAGLLTPLSGAPHRAPLWRLGCRRDAGRTGIGRFSGTSRIQTKAG